MDADILTTVLGSDIIAASDAAIPAFTGLSIDSRSIKKGEIFFAIVGDKNDGHNFVLRAFEAGAAAAVVERSRLHLFVGKTPGLLLAVNDTHEALLNLAAYLRRRIDARFAAVTGSNGKTTTKEMLYAIMNVRHRTFRSPGNLNNLYGLPISLGMMPSDVPYAIFELGISTIGEMTRLASVIKPEVAIITNVGPTHLETLHSVDNVGKAKFELVDHLPVGAVCVLNVDDPLIMREARARRLEFIGFGIENEAPFQARDIQLDETGAQVFTVAETTIILPAVGRVNIYNALAAIAASSVWGCTPADWIQGLAAFRPVDMRLTIEQFAGLHLIIDCYNANPGSMAAALRLLSEFSSTGKKIAVLGDMLELGETSAAHHFEAGRQAAGSDARYLFCLGPQSQQIIAGAVAAGFNPQHARHFLKHQKLLDGLLDVISVDDTILFKGSRGMELEKIVVGLKGSAFKNN